MTFPFQVMESLAKNLPELISFFQDVDSDVSFV